ncbi:hypothetical protein GCM10027275_03850 [Rhabdobacter roseus]|uniref:histidine kinase n=1 Tax=Rhabdobacter roseus TaxID=1655419 RepID=A0A840TFJ9_9BACT|nr:two-component sensor histidine kinase [Rhabdobacter roseus]
MLTVSLATAQVPERIAQLPNDSTKIVALCDYATQIAFDQGKIEEAYGLIRQAEELNQTTPSAYAAACVVKANGIVAHANEKFPEAVRLLLQAYDLFLKKGYTLEAAESLVRVSHVHFKEDNLEASERYLVRAEALLKNYPESTKSKVMMGNIYNELSNIYGKRKQPNQSLEYINKALQLYRETQNEDRYYSSLLNSAISYKNLGLFDESLERYQEFENYVEKINDDYYRLYLYMNLPYALMGKNQVDQAIAYAQKGLALVPKTSGQFEHYAEVHGILSEAYEKKRDYQAALHNYRLKEAYGDSLTDLQKKRQIAELETQFETKQKELQIEQLNVQHQAKQRQTLLLSASLLLLLLLLGVMAWQYVRLRRSKEQIAEQSAQLKLMMKELHHRVKNNLAIVSGLLKLQSNRITEVSAAKAVREGQQRVEAMSLIHQRLYQTDHVTSVNIREYIIDLAENLMQSYGYDRDAFDLRIDVERTQLDVDLAIPIGLIINELLTNSFKHAYEGVQRPMLIINLRNNDGITLEVKDNGPGVDPIEWKKTSNSFGKRLITNLSEQTGGEFRIENTDGMHYYLHIPSQNLRKAA